MELPVRVCTQELVKLDLEIKALIQDIRECEGPHSVLTQLNGRVREKLKLLRARIEDLERMALEQDRETDKREILHEVENHRKQLISDQVSLRKANVSSKQTLDLVERQELVQPGNVLRQRTAKQDVVRSAGDVTASLMSLSRLMTQQVHRSDETVQTLVTSSQTLTSTNEEFKVMSGTLSMSRRILTKYNRRELTDRLLIILALALFLATVLYILKKRIWLPF
uniref:vesicle transport protein SEC20 n=1 Tax=Myxine glutinosa TaxID=7769 RepID=UPI00358F75E4